MIITIGRSPYNPSTDYDCREGDLREDAGGWLQTGYEDSRHEPYQVWEIPHPACGRTATGEMIAYTNAGGWDSCTRLLLNNRIPAGAKKLWESKKYWGNPPIFTR